MSFEVEYFTLDTTDSSNRYVVLDGTPISTSNVAMDLIGGTAQALGLMSEDFGVTDSSVVWDSTDYALYDQLADGDRIRIIYDRS